MIAGFAETTLSAKRLACCTDERNAPSRRVAKTARTVAGVLALHGAALWCLSQMPVAWRSAVAATEPLGGGRTTPAILARERVAGHERAVQVLPELNAMRTFGPVQVPQGHYFFLGDSDKHLDVALSVHQRLNPETNQVELTVSTVVHIHNLLGRLYMLPVAPVHKLIVPSVLRALG
jgi:hypothetical protein